MLILHSLISQARLILPMYQFLNRENLKTSITSNALYFSLLALMTTSLSPRTRLLSLMLKIKADIHSQTSPFQMVFTNTKVDGPTFTPCLLWQMLSTTKVLPIKESLPISKVSNGRFQTSTSSD